MLRNKFEARIYASLKAKKIKFKYESEKIPYLISGHYVPDFIITTRNGKIYIETKGHFRPEAKRKMAAVKKLNPQLDIRILFYSYSKSSVKWCVKNNFPYAIGDIPNEWLWKHVLVLRWCVIHAIHYLPNRSICTATVSLATLLEVYTLEELLELNDKTEEDCLEFLVEEKFIELPKIKPLDFEWNISGHFSIVHCFLE